jgi:hypothetical protein
MKQKLIKLILVCSVLPLTGCAPGLVSVLGTPTSAETKVPPEYDITKEKGKKVLTLVEQPYFLRTNPNLRYIITVCINKILEDRAKIRPEMFISYDALAQLRSSAADFSMLTPAQVGSQLGADYVLVVTINNYQLGDKNEQGFFTGRLEAQAQLFSVSTAEKLWPEMETARKVMVGFDSVRSSADSATLRLAGNAAHCVTRFLYKCPINQFKSADEESEIGWGQ